MTQRLPGGSWRTHATIRLMRLLAPVVVPLFYALIRIVPERAVLGSAGWFGRVLRIGMRERVLANFRMVFGADALDAAGLERFWDAHARSIGLTVTEPFLLRKLDNDAVHGVLLLEGEEHLRQALAAGKGAMLFVNHLGSIGMVAGAFGVRGYDIVIAGNVMPTAYIEREAQRLYASVGAARVHVGANLPYRAAEVFGRNGVFATFIDFSILSKRNAWLRFGKAALHANLGPALIALRNGTPVLCATTTRLAWNRHRITVHPPLAVESSGDSTHDATQLTSAALRLLFQDLEAHPEQWWQWYTNRIRPEPEALPLRELRPARRAQALHESQQP